MANRDAQPGHGNGSAARVLVLDGLELVREGIRGVLATTDDLEFVGEGPVDAAALEMIAEQRPEVVLADLDGAGTPNLDLVRAIAARHPQTRVVLFSGRADQDLLWEALEAGARGFLLKDLSSQALVAAIRQVVAGEPCVDDRLAPDVLRQLARPRAQGVLSERERQILQMLADGASNRDVSQRLVVSVETVKTHVKHILSKLEAKHRTQAVAIGIRRSLIR